MPSKFNVIENYRDPYAAERRGSSGISKLWQKYKPELVAYVNDLNAKAGEHNKLLARSARGDEAATAEMLDQLAGAYNPSGIVKAGAKLIGIEDAAYLINKLTEKQYFKVKELLNGADPYHVNDFNLLMSALVKVEPSLKKTFITVDDDVARRVKEASNKLILPKSASQMHDLVEQSKLSARDVASRAEDSSGLKLEMGVEPSYANTRRAFEQGFKLPGYRVVPYGDTSLIHPQAGTPGAHFAPVGREEQLIDILNKYYQEDGFEVFKPALKPRMSTVYANPEGMIYVDDASAENANILASRLGLTDELRNAPGYNGGRSVSAPRLIEELAQRKGVNSLLYENIYEGVGGGPSKLFRNIENPSVSILKQANIREGSNFAQGGLVSTGYNPSLVNALAAQLEAELFN